MSDARICFVGVPASTATRESDSGMSKRQWVPLLFVAVFCGKIFVRSQTIGTSAAAVCAPAQAPNNILKD